MKATRIMLILGAAALMLFGLTTVNYAFHSGGVAECEGCHTMHNSLGNVRMTINANPIGVANPYLLVGQDPSSTCLDCHAQPDTAPSSYHIMTLPFAAATLPVEMTPGGDFTWLAKDFTWVPRAGSATEESLASEHGHNVVAADFGMLADTRLTAAPGGSYASTALSCISCHDPHGKTRMLDTAGTFSTTGKAIRTSGSYGADPNATFAVGAYRLLGGVGYAPASQPTAPAFTIRPMIAAVNSSYNRTENTSSTRVSYGSGSSDWCSNCHNAMHSVLSTVPGGHVHPTDVALGGTIAANYNSYIMSGNRTGSGATAFTSLVPFQKDNYVQNSVLATFRTSTAGPLSNDRVSCLTCHRAHAGGWNSILRFSYGNEFMTVSDAAGTAIYADPATNPAQAQGRTTAETARAYYDRPATTFSPYQRVLCNKCHAQD